MFSQNVFVVIIGLTLGTKSIIHISVVGYLCPMVVYFCSCMRMADVGVNITLHPASHSSPIDMSALSIDLLKTETCVDDCGRVIPRGYIYICVVYGCDYVAIQ